MISKFISLEWKAFTRSSSFGSNLAIKIVMGFLAFLMILYFLMFGVFAYFIIEEKLKLDPFLTINKFLIFYLLIDLVVRYFLQKMPIIKIKPLLYLPLKKKTIINFGI
ncbi:MAG TPA: hypothetical protein EYO76_10630, partial [Flavobacteriaceae bacterium]|nr:hypothetical protein [Flavobacteriaceae bacterium]